MIISGNRNNTKKFLTTQSRNLKWELNNLTLQDASDLIQKWLVDYGPTATLDIGTEYEDGGDRVYVRVFTRREETDEEYEGRLAQEARDSVMREQRERAEFERLEKKFKGEAK